MKSSRLFIFALLGSACLSVNVAGAASHCKGLSATACATDGGCRWVAGYTRKDGREVSAHCRLGKTDAKIMGGKDGEKKLSAVD
jgi:hypothetical protein